MTQVNTPFKNILLIGATGSIGRYILSALLAEPSLTITILRRASPSSSSTATPNIRTITIPDTYPTADLTAAFRGQDAIISCLTTLSTHNQFRFIDAAIAAGVRRYVPSEYGLNNMRPDAQALNNTFRDKGAVQAYLREKAAEGKIEWMSCHDGGEYGVGSGEGGLVRIPEETRNVNVLISEFVTTQKELLMEIERQLGEKLAVTEVDGRKRIAEMQAKAKEGDVMAAMGLIEAGFITGRYGGNLEKEGELFNDRLGLENHTLEDVVADALAKLQ
ncbi:hypothetical protein N0V88_000168 [Collariella sp. IMI 366227]|nr:hypothetical protein N0V88_000168 [Collariella sp. IMI 366227]